MAKTTRNKKGQFIKSSRRNTVAAKKKRTVTRYVKRSPRRKSGMRFPIAVLAGFVPLAAGVYSRRGSATQIGEFIQSSFTGVGPNGQFDFNNLRTGTLPIIMGILVHKAAGALGVNRSIGASGLKWVRV